MPAAIRSYIAEVQTQVSAGAACTSTACMFAAGHSKLVHGTVQKAFCCFRRLRHGKELDAAARVKIQQPAPPPRSQLSTLVDWPEAGVSNEEKLGFFRCGTRQPPLAVTRSSRQPRLACSSWQPCFACSSWQLRLCSWYTHAGRLGAAASHSALLFSPHLAGRCATRTAAPRSCSAAVAASAASTS